MSAQTDWLLAGDPAIRFLTQRDLLHAPEETCRALQQRMVQDGVCAQLLALQRADGHWGLHYYQPKWTSTHYTLLELKNLGAPPALEACRGILSRMFDACALPSGAMNLSKHDHPGDTCVDGMVLNYASYFCPDEPRLDRLAKRLLAEQKPDGGFTWDARSDLGDPHTTICVLEGLSQYAASRIGNAKADTADAVQKGASFLLANNLFLYGEDRRFTKLTYPARYRYDVLRALEYFAREEKPFDPRMREAVCWLIGKRTREGLWPLEYTHPGNVHVVLEERGQPSRFITYRAMLALERYERAAMGE